jgi:hypothetical protein
VDNYFRTFDLTGFDPATASISGLWTLDDVGTLSLNGHVIDTQTGTPWFSLHAFSVPAGSPFFLPGLNTLEISITGSDNFIEGVRLEGTLIATPVPEPTSVALFSLALVGGLCTRHYRRIKSVT